MKLFHGEDKKDWHDARSHCRSFGGELVSVHSLEENAEIINLVRMITQLSFLILIIIIIIGEYYSSCYFLFCCRLRRRLKAKRTLKILTHT